MGSSSVLAVRKPVVYFVAILLSRQCLGTAIVCRIEQALTPFGHGFDVGASIHRPIVQIVQLDNHLHYIQGKLSVSIALLFSVIYPRFHW